MFQGYIGKILGQFIVFWECMIWVLFSVKQDHHRIPVTTSMTFLGSDIQKTVNLNHLLLSFGEIFHIWRYKWYLRWAPASYNWGEITPASRVEVTPVTNIYKAIYRGPPLKFALQVLNPQQVLATHNLWMMTKVDKGTDQGLGTAQGIDDVIGVCWWRSQKSPKYVEMSWPFLYPDTYQVS